MAALIQSLYLQAPHHALSLSPASLPGLRSPWEKAFLKEEGVSGTGVWWQPEPRRVTG